MVHVLRGVNVPARKQSAFSRNVSNATPPNHTCTLTPSVGLCIKHVCAIDIHGQAGTYTLRSGHISSMERDDLLSFQTTRQRL